MRPRFKNDLKAVPTVSIVMNTDDMFGPERHLQQPDNRSGPSWERAYVGGV